jgi:hypothetical protein
MSERAVDRRLAHMRTSTVPGRNAFALAARMRVSAGPMHDRRAPRGGARDAVGDWLAEWASDEADVPDDLGAPTPVRVPR